jgi:hypothetical protein
MQFLFLSYYVLLTGMKRAGDNSECKSNVYKYKPVNVELRRERDNMAALVCFIENNRHYMIECISWIKKDSTVIPIFKQTMVPPFGTLMVPILLNCKSCKDAVVYTLISVRAENNVLYFKNEQRI